MRKNKQMLFLIVIVAVFLTACDNPFQKPRLPTALSGGITSGMGRVIIGLEESDSRTLFPSSPKFVSYFLEFQYQGDGTEEKNAQQTTSLPCPVELAPGPWLVTVTAYTRIVGVEGVMDGNYPAAKGSATVTASLGITVSVSVDLYSGMEMTGKGILEYQIGLPEGIGSAILRVRNMSKATISSKDLMEAASGKIALDAGYYLLQVQIAGGRARSKTELIHIFGGNTTRAVGSAWNFNTQEGVYLSVAELSVYLVTTPANTADNPYSIKLIVNMESLSGGQDALGQLFSALRGRYVNLNLSESAGNIGNSASTPGTDRDKLVSVILPDGLTNIGDYAFNNCTSLKKVTLPLRIGTVPASAFTGCDALDSLIFTGTQTSASMNLSALNWLKTADLSACASLTTINGNVFTNCAALETVLLPESLTTIDGNVFKGCTSLKTLPEMPLIQNITNSAFEGCTGLYSGTGSLDLSGYTNLTVIGDNAFKNCTQFTSFVLPRSLQSLGAAFSGCTGLITGLTNANLSALIYLKSISGTFNGFKGLVSVILPAGLETIGNECFNGCSALTTVSIPQSLKYIKDSAFRDCNALILTGLFNLTALLSIGDNAFRGCTIPQILDLSGLTSLERIGDNAFYNCPSLTTLNLSGLTHLASIGGSAFYSCRTMISLNLSGLTSLESIGSRAFYNCPSLTTLDLSGLISLKSIGDWAFNNAAFISIGPGQQYSVNIQGCNNLITFSGFYNNKNLILADLSSLNTLTSIGLDSFSGCTALSSVNLSGLSALTSIGDSAFSSCTALSSVDLSYLISLKSIGDSAFAGCTALALIDLSALNKLINIGDSAFNGCTSLTSVDLSGNAIAYIGYSAFTYCPSLILLDLSGTYSPPATGYNRSNIYDSRPFDIKDWFHNYAIIYSPSEDLVIYVPAGSVDTYRNASYWSGYASQIQAKP